MGTEHCQDTNYKYCPLEFLAGCASVEVWVENRCCKRTNPACKDLVGRLCVYEKHICDRLAGNVYIRPLRSHLLCCVASQEHMNEPVGKCFNMERVKAADTNLPGGRGTGCLSEHLKRILRKFLFCGRSLNFFFSPLTRSNLGQHINCAIALN